MEIKLNLKDKVLTSKGSGVVTRINDKSIWLDDNRYGLESVLKNIKNVFHFESPDANIDWANPKEVDGYYLTFEQWAGVIRMGDTKTKEILEVKNNKVFYNGEYYLPYYSHYTSSDKEKKFLNDCFIFGYCVKIKNHFWSTEAVSTVNVFYYETVISTEQAEYNKTKTANKKVLNDIEYLKSLDYKHINSSDLDLLKVKCKDMFDLSSLPYTVNNVTFGVGHWKDIAVSHRNRSGQIKIDNGYNGATPFKNDYYAIVRVSPNFTNECNYSDSVRVEGKNITFDKAMLDKLSVKVVEIWDKAIEANAKNWG